MAKKTKEERQKMWEAFRESCKQDRLPTIKPYNLSGYRLAYCAQYPWTNAEILELKGQLAPLSPDSVYFILDRITDCKTKEEINKLLRGEVEAEEKRIQAILKQINDDDTDDVDDTDVDNDFDNIEGLD